MKKNTFLIAAVMFTVSGTNSVFAAEGDTADEQVIEEVLVTATRRTESLQDVPISISVVSAEDIIGTGTIDIKSLSTMVPNFVFADSPNQGLSFMSIRGIYSRSEPSAIGLDQSVGVYVDGVFHSRQFNANANMGDVERV